MCGRYSLFRLQEALEELHLQTTSDFRTTSNLQPSYNIAPTQQAVVVLNIDPKHAISARWGLVPSWAKDQKLGYRMINARAETLSEKPAFKRLLTSKRCVVLADGFYEWKKHGTTKTPYRIEYTRGVFLMAGLWDEWTAPSGDVMTTFTIITTTPNKTMCAIHDRMPVMLVPQEYERWLQTGDVTLLRPIDDALLKTFQISDRVNIPKNNDARVISPVQVLTRL